MEGSNGHKPEFKFGPDQIGASNGSNTLAHVDIGICARCGQRREVECRHGPDVLCLECYRAGYYFDADDTTDFGNDLPGFGSFAARFVANDLDEAQMRPQEWLWHPLIPMGAFTLEIGEEDVGKSTLQAYIAAKVSAGEIGEQPGRVLYVGADEDGLYDTVMPRLKAAGADFENIKVFEPVDENAIFNIVDDVTEFDRVLREGRYALVVFDHLMDVLPPMRSYTDPAAMRGVLLPLRRLLRNRRIAALATLHTNKGRHTNLRDLQQGTVQYGALSRSSFLVAKHPEDFTRRVIVPGKGNWIAQSAKTGFSFQIVETVFERGEHVFNVGRVADLCEDTVTLEDVLRPGSGVSGPSMAEMLADQIKELPSRMENDGCWTPERLATAVGRRRDDGSFKAAIRLLVDAGEWEVEGTTRNRRYRPI